MSPTKDPDLEHLKQLHNLLYSASDSKLLTMDKLTKLDVDAVLKGKYPAKSHAKRVAKYLLANGKSKDSILYLEGQKTRMLEDNDEAAPFRSDH